MKSYIFHLQTVGLNKKQMLNFISVKFCLALKNKTCVLRPGITHWFMSQNEYLHRLVQIIYDTTFLNTTHYVFAATAKEPREGVCLTVKLQAAISNKQCTVVEGGEGRTTLMLPKQCANI